MKALFKRLMALVLSMAMLIPCINLGGLGEKVQAAAAPGNGIHYLDDQHARALIGFIYDKSKLTDAELNAGGMYTFLTGGYAAGSLEEIGARIIFLTVAKANISQCMSKYDTVLDNSYAQLLKVLTEIAGGDMDDGLANDTLGDIADGVAAGFMLLGDVDDEIIDLIDTAKAGYQNTKSLTDKVEKMRQGVETAVSGFFYIWSGSRKNMYTYVDQYVRNRPLKDSCPAAFDTMMAYNVSALKSNMLGFDPILNWASKDHLAVLNTFGDFIYEVEQSLANPASYSQTYKTYQVHCPTDVYLYREDGTLAVSILGNEISVSCDGIYAAEYDSQKILTVPADQEYTLKILGTDAGTMDYSVSEYSAGSLVRTVEFYDLPLHTGCEYTDTLPERVCVPGEEYSLTTESGQTVTPDYDSLPPVAGDITDVVTAEELFAHIPAEVITLVSDALFRMESSVDIAQYSLGVEDAVALFSAVAKHSPIEYSLIANGEFTYQILYDAATDRITSLRFDYGTQTNLDTFQRRVAELKAQINTLVAQIDGMSDFEKALYIHDYIVLNCQYDLELLEILQTEGKITGELRSERYSEYSVLVNGTGICGSYALAYRAILNAAGMECIYLSSKQMNHAWNMVKVDGAWYHVDCCWDDPAPDRPWAAERTYFLRTDREMMQLNHYSWTPGQYKSAGTRYAQMPRKSDVSQNYDYSTDRWYYLNGNTLYSADQYGEDARILQEGLSANAIACDQGLIYYVDGKLISVFDPNTGTSQPAYLLSDYEAGAQPEKASILNAYISDQNLFYFKNVWQYPGDGSEPVETVVRVDTVLDTQRLNSITGIGLETTELTLEVFGSYYLYAYLISEYEVWDLSVTLSSSDETVVSVDQYGEIRALNVGTATVTASFLNHSAECTVTVTGVEGTPAGSCGSNVKWSYDTDTGKLSITGRGPMTDYSYSNTPWYPYIFNIKEVSVGDGVTSIGHYAFAYGMEIKAVTISNTVTSIGNEAFLYCTALENLVLPEGVTAIGKAAFHTCTGLQSVNIPKGVKELKESTFERCYSLVSVSIPQGMTAIPDYLFEGCTSLKELTIPQGVTKIGQSAFQDCEMLTELIIPPKVTTINAYAFAGCKGLTHAELPESVRYVSSNLFSNCTSLETVILPSTLTSISSSVFKGCYALTQITIPDSVTEIGISAFADCWALQRIVIPAKVSNIGYSAFDYCLALEQISVEPDNPNYSSDAEGVLFNKNKTVLEAYPAGRPQGHYTVPDTVTELNSFCLSQNLASITLGKNVTRIGSNAFWRCFNLTSIVLNKALTTVDMGAFSECRSLRHVGYPGSQEAYAKISINTYNNTFLTNAPYIHCDFDPAADLVQTGEQLPSCIRDGNAAGVRCNDCDIWLEGGEPVQATGHSYERTEVFAGSCTQAPYEVYVCSECQDSQTLVGSVSLGHNYVTTVIAPTCTEKGFTLQTCTVCAETAVSDFTAPTGHALTIEDRQDHCVGHGSCLYRCSRCDYVEYVAADASQLQTRTVLVEATCTSGGSETVLCALCDATVSVRFLEAAGHTLETQSNGAVSCTVCGTVITPASGAVLSGSVRSSGKGSVTLELWSEGIRIASVSTEDGSYTFDSLTAGDYLLMVSKENHVTRSYTLHLQAESATQDVSLYLLGDVNGDGKVNMGDISRLYAHVRCVNPLTDPYLLECADVNGKGINMSDIGSLLGHIRGTKTLY